MACATIVQCQVPVGFAKREMLVFPLVFSLLSMLLPWRKNVLFG